jgi:uncharacterized protein (TIGR03083 family)
VDPADGVRVRGAGAADDEVARRHRLARHAGDHTSGMSRTSTPLVSPRLTKDAAVGHLDAAAARFAAALGGDLGAPVPSCPGWDLRALAAHLGGVHRWARSALIRPRPDEHSDDGPAPGVDLRAWFAQGVRDLVQTLAGTDPARECWTFGPRPRTAAFWFRRQAHETAMHAWDAERAHTPTPAPFDPELALDGVDELVTMFVPRQIRLGRLAPFAEVVELRAVEAPAAPCRLSGADPAAPAVPRDPDAVVSAPAGTVLLLLWRRIPLDTAGVHVDGDVDVVRTLLASPLTP